MDRGYGGMTSFYEAHPNLKKYASVTSVLSVLSEPSKEGELIHHQDVASWKQSIVLDSIWKQDYVYTEKAGENGMECLQSAKPSIFHKRSGFHAACS